MRLQSASAAALSVALVVLAGCDRECVRETCRPCPVTPLKVTQAPEDQYAESMAVIRVYTGGRQPYMLDQGILGNRQWELRAWELRAAEPPLPPLPKIVLQDDLDNMAKELTTLREKVSQHPELENSTAPEASNGAWRDKPHGLVSVWYYASEVERPHPNEGGVSEIK